MKEDQQRFLSLLGRLPVRLTSEQVAWVLNCRPHDVPIPFASRLLKPLGNPPQNIIKLVRTDELLELAKDRSWLAKATNAIHQHWRAKNARKRSVMSESAAEEKSRSNRISQSGCYGFMPRPWPFTRKNQTT